VTGTRTSQSGFTLVEVLVATTIMVVVTAGIFDVVSQSGGVFQVQPEVSELQQRLRVGVTQIRRDLMDAGAGSYSGLNDTTNYQTARSLANYFAPVLPYVQSSDANDDGRGRFFSNRITIISVPTAAAQTSLKSDMSSGFAQMQVADPLRGFHAATPDGIGTKAVIYDGTGAFDEFVVTAVDEGGANLGFQHLQQAVLSQAYKVPSRISEVTSHAYFLKADTQQLMYDDGFGNVTPMLDNVVALKFEYYGDPSPPAFVAPGTPNLSTTYGPAPPGLNATTPIGSWPLGENCVWTIRRVGETATYEPRLPPIGDGGLALAPLPAESLTDGPWCPDAASANRYDADLLRIRKIRVTLRLQTGNAALRGSLIVGPDAMFVTPGTARSLSKAVPDRAIQFDVSPRNLNLGR
jgi:prepilin-type N-terminal cleavage/methylation domain-containing protein